MLLPLRGFESWCWEIHTSTSRPRFKVEQWQGQLDGMGNDIRCYARGNSYGKDTRPGREHEE